VSLEIIEKDREGIAILECKGRLVLGNGTEMFRERTRAVLGTGKKSFILNLMGVNHIDSSGLGELVALSDVLGRDTGRVKLVQLNRKQVALLVITKLTTVFELYDDEQEAVNSFFPDRRVRSFDLLSFVRELNRDGA
jgi:anti-sigma B factor antagonist